MSAIKKVENLKDAHIKFILGCLSYTSDFHQIKQKFQEFFETGVSGEVLIQVAETHKDKVIELKISLPFDERAKDIPMADPVVQIKMLDTLYKECLIPRVVNVTRDGTDIEKVDHPTALRCIEVASRIRNMEKELEFKKALLAAQENPSGESVNAQVAGTSGGFAVKIIHHVEEDDDGV